jgi:hypothetical protein
MKKLAFWKNIIFYIPEGILVSHVGVARYLLLFICPETNISYARSLDRTLNFWHNLTLDYTIMPTVSLYFLKDFSPLQTHSCFIIDGLIYNYAKWPKHKWIW